MNEDKHEDRHEAKHEPGKRLFVGARISVATANALAGAAETLARRARDAGVDLRWVAPASYHVTMRFLGWTRAEAIGAVRDALDEAAAGISPLSFRTTRLGAFPSLDRATVVWAGVEAPRPLLELAERVEAACVRLGYRPERRPFHPHVTIGRLRDARAVKEVVLPLAEQMFGDTALDSITLFESETKSSGSVYRELHKIRLESRPKPPISAPERQTSPVELAHKPVEPDTDDGWPRGQGANPDHDV
jgi:RNA 2',3'-cyclic 3'-phosphodiesterase